MRPLHQNQSSFDQLNASQRQDAARITTIDLAYRSLPGTFMYLVCWFFLYFVIQARSDTELTDQWLSLISQVVVIGAVLRVLLVMLARRFIDQVNTSRGWLALGVLLNSLTWGIMAACASLDTPLTPHSELILLTTAWISAGGAISFSVSRFFTALFLCGTLHAVTNIVEFGRHGLPLVKRLGTHLTYMVDAHQAGNVPAFAFIEFCFRTVAGRVVALRDLGAAKHGAQGLIHIHGELVERAVGALFHKDRRYKRPAECQSGLSCCARSAIG